MRYIINYIRQCFCKHDFELLVKNKYCDEHNKHPHKVTYIYRCKKCGYYYKIKT